MSKRVVFNLRPIDASVLRFESAALWLEELVVANSKDNGNTSGESKSKEIRKVEAGGGIRELSLYEAQLKLMLRPR